MRKTIREAIQEKERKQQENKNIITIGVISVIWIVLILAVITSFNIMT
jgi:DMSO/TMAO reductase YedYZ heme-binding membrane subunit